MSSLPSSSGSANGHVGHVNGAASHNTSESGVEPAEASLGGSQSSEYPVNGFSQPSYQNPHNEEIISHLYHAGFQTGGFAIALGYLYSAISLNLIRPHNARAVLAAGCLLGGMEDLCRYSYEACRQSISVDTIGSWVEFIDSMPSSSDGTTTPDLPKTSIFGLYAQRLKDDVFHFLVDILPEFLDVHQPPSERSAAPGPHGRDVLLQIYSRVPFEMFKTAVESPSFRVDPTGSDQARFKFAKEAIELRKRGIARGSGAEETVVLAFGGGNGAGNSVHITRKMRKRPLWKVNA
ncbi:hypothetical protein DXG01_013302 [Tephrocybe rancida]|nr:hypothetical protein DXG01_013302 [Tephrocybe rancida]